ncbi:hypothetical protein R6Q59_029995 [Mikania micrantha]
MEKWLRDKGLKGSPYKFFFGDSKELEQMTIEARSKPMNLSNDISHRVFPFFYKAVATHEKRKDPMRDIVRDIHGFRSGFDCHLLQLFRISKKELVRATLSP